MAEQVDKFEDVLKELAENCDGAVLYWQTGKRFKEAFEAGAIKMVGELLVHPDAIEIEEGMAYMMPET